MEVHQIGTEQDEGNFDVLADSLFVLASASGSRRGPGEAHHSPKGKRLAYGGGRKADKWFMVVDGPLGPEYNALGHFRFSPACINALTDWSQRADGEGANLD